MLTSDSPRVLCCLLLVCCVTSPVFALRGSSVVINARAKAAEPTTASSNDNGDGEENGEMGEGLPPVENSTKPILTGNPQIDYVHDPNLPRELNGYNLSSYPFFNKVPSDITFKCDGLHDGFYASIPHKCQLYHHCLFGTRYDFLCANYTAFDQKTFICQFVSEVDCENSARYFKRNDDLYKAKETTTIPTTTTSTTTTTTQAPTTSRDTYRERERDRDYRDRDYRDRDRMRDRDYRDRDRDRDDRDRDYRDRDRVRNRDRDYRDRDYRDRMRERERERPRDSERERPRDSHRKRKPMKRRRPVYEYYYDDVYADEEYEDDPLPPPVAKKSRKVLESVKPVIKPVTKSSERDFAPVSPKRKSKYDDEELLRTKSEEDKPFRTKYHDDKALRAKYDEPLSVRESVREPSVRESSGREPSARESSGREPSTRDSSARESSGRESSAREPSSREPSVRESSRKLAPISRSEEYDDEYYEDEIDEDRPASQPAKATSQGSQRSGTPVVVPASPISVFSRPRVPPRINRPVPLNEKSKYEYVKN